MDYEALLKSQLIESRAIPAGTITIPVVVHVVYYNSPQNISDAQIRAQIQVLNEDFRRLNADRVNTPAVWQSIAGDANIEFKLAETDPYGNSTTGITRTSTTVNGFYQSLQNVKKTSAGGRDPWNTQKYLNIWVCNFLSSDPNYILFGYSSFPQDLATSPNLDGVVINYQYFGVGGHTLYPYNKGRTTTHEVGHWLDLRHIWGDSASCSIDDGVTDTPVQTASTYGCPSFPKTDACSSVPPGIMFMNFMDYTYDGCMNLFTNGQKARMRTLFDNVNGLRRQIYAAPIINGPGEVSYNGSTFTLNNPPAGTVYWTLSNTSIFSLSSSSGNPVTITRLGMNSSSATLSARTGSTNGPVIATKNIIASPFEISGPSSINAIDNGSGYRDAWGRVFVVNSPPNANRYEWDTIYYGDYDRWYIWPSGNMADLSVYLKPGDGGGGFSVTCKVYNGNTLIATLSKYVSVILV